MRILPPTILNQTEYEWRLGSHNHAVKVDSGHDGWETMCGRKILHPWHIKNKRPPTTESPFCKRCLAKTKSTIAIIKALA